MSQREREERTLLTGRGEHPSQWASHFSGEESALAACQELILHAALQWRMIEGDYRDDITAIVIRLPLPLSDRNSNSVSTTFSDN